MQFGCAAKQMATFNGQLLNMRESRNIRAKNRKISKIRMIPKLFLFYWVLWCGQLPILPLVLEEEQRRGARAYSNCFIRHTSLSCLYGIIVVVVVVGWTRWAILAANNHLMLINHSCFVTEIVQQWRHADRRSRPPAREQSTRFFSCVFCLRLFDIAVSHIYIYWMLNFSFFSWQWTVVQRAIVRCIDSKTHTAR